MTLHLTKSELNHYITKSELNHYLTESELNQYLTNHHRLVTRCMSQDFLS